MASLRLLRIALLGLTLGLATPVWAQAGPDSQAVAGQRRLLAKAIASFGSDQSAAAINARWALATALANEQRNAEAEAEYLALEAILLPRLGAQDPNLVFLKSWIAEMQMRQARWEEAVGTARPLLAQLRAAFGAEHESVYRTQLVLAASLAALERYAEAEPHARVNFDHFRRTGRMDDAADIAATLAAIYRNTGRPDEAREVLLLVDGGDALRSLINEAERAETPETQVAGWRAVLDATPQDDPTRPQVELRLILALNAVGGTEEAEAAATGEAIVRARRLAAEARAAGDERVLANAENLLATALTTRESGPTTSAEADEALAILYRQWRTAADADGEESHDAVDARIAYAMSAAAVDRPDLALPHLGWLEAYMAGNPAAIDPETAAFVAMTRATALGQQDDLAGAYRALAQTTERFQSVAMTRSSIQGERDAGYLDRWSGLFNMRVKLGWRYSDQLQGVSEPVAPTARP